MRFLKSASSIILMALLLSGCDSLGLPNIFAHDNVPQEVKDAPRLVALPPEAAPDSNWPRLGDVPPRPRDFSPKLVNDHYMDELSYDRDDAAAAKRDVESASGEVPAPPEFLK